MESAWRAAGRIAVAVACLLSSACATYGHALRDVELALRQGRPADALARLERLDGGARNEALYYINKGMLLRMNGDINGSVAAFEAAKPLLVFQEATSVTETAARFALAEATTSYQPRPFERLQLHVMQALNQLELGNWNEARVEALQIDLLLRRLHDGAAPNGSDAFARYVSGIIFEGLQEDDDALIAYRKAFEACERAGRSIPADLQRRLLVLTYRLGLKDEHAAFLERFGDAQGRRAEALAAQGGGELLLIAMTGLVPRRHEVTSVHQDFTSGKIYRLSLPALYARSGGALRITLREDGRELGHAETVADLAVAAEQALQDELPGLIARAIARNVVKNRIANEAGKENPGMEFLVNFASAAMENADVRSWSTLPDRIHLLRVPLPRGEHALEVAFEGRGAPEKRDLGRITITPRRPAVVVVHQLAN